MDESSERSPSEMADARPLLEPEMATRMACDLCRRRKLKCDRQVPMCSSCTRLGYKCIYGSFKVKKSPRRAHVRQLENRLAQIESLLHAKNSGTQDIPERTAKKPINESGQGPGGLRLSQTQIKELETIYFEFVAYTGPMIHRRRYYASLDLGTLERPPAYLRYAMWAVGAQNSKDYKGIHEKLYKVARRDLEELELRDDMFETVTLAQTQTWIMIAHYEMMEGHLHRSWMSAGRAIRLTQAMKLHCLDKDDYNGFHVPQTTVAMDWTDAEEQRRTFWTTYCLDHQLSIGLGWPMSINEDDIRTTLPASEEAYQNSTETRTFTLAQAMSTSTAESLSPFAAMIVITSLSSRKLQALRRHEPGQASPESGVWLKNTFIENALNTDFVIPPHLSLSLSSLTFNPFIIFLNMFIPCLNICVHQEAEIQALKHNVPLNALLGSQRKRLQMADIISQVLKFSFATDFNAIPSLTSWCVYKAGLVYARSLGQLPNEKHEEALICILAGLEHLKAKNPLPEMFLMHFRQEFPSLYERLSGPNSEFHDIFRKMGINANGGENGSNGLKMVASSEFVGLKCNNATPSTNNDFVLHHQNLYTTEESPYVDEFTSGSMDSVLDSSEDQLLFGTDHFLFPPNLDYSQDF